MCVWSSKYFYSCIGAGSRNSKLANLQYSGFARIDPADQRQYHGRLIKHNKLERSVDNGRGQRYVHDSCGLRCLYRYCWVADRSGEYWRRDG
jgi:hypothetical protein